MAKEPLIIENNGLDAPAPTDDTGILWESRVNALLREREAYVKRNMDDRVKSVDAELERIGYRGSKTVDDTRAVPVTETVRALPKATPKDAASTAKDGGK